MKTFIDCPDSDSRRRVVRLPSKGDRVQLPAGVYLVDGIVWDYDANEVTALLSQISTEPADYYKPPRKPRGTW